MAKWLVRDAGGIIIALLAWILMVGCGVYMIRWSFTHHYWLLSIIYLVMFPLCGVTHFRTMTTNPGQYSGQSTTKSATMVHCDDCNASRPVTASHCSTCGICIVLLDHHCPWMNNCIGLGNHKLFLQYLCYIWLTCILVILPLAALHTGVVEKYLLAFALLFWLFTSCMIPMQFYCIAFDPILTKVHLYFCPTTTALSTKQKLKNHLALLFFGQPIHSVPKRQRWIRICCPEPLDWNDSLHDLFTQEVLHMV